MPTEALKQNHIKMYNTANTVTAGWCSSLKSNGAWDKRKKKHREFMQNPRKTCVLPHCNYKFPCQQRHWHCNHKIAKLPNLIAFEIWSSSTRCLSPNQEFATNPSFKPIFLVLNNSPLVQGKYFTEGIGAIFTHLTKSSLEQFLTQTFWVN